MNKLQRLLKRQLKKANLDENTQQQIAPFLKQVNEAYKAFDSDYNHLENILEISSQELFLANQQLKDNIEVIKSKLSNVAENIQEVIFEIDLDGNWSYLNPAWEKFTGLKVKDSIGKPYYQFLDNKVYNPLKYKIDLKNPNHNVLNQNISYVTHDGQEKWFDFSLKNITSEEGHAKGYIGTIVDISNLKKTELALIKAKEKETEANKAKDEFLSTISHEIRTPINAVLGISHLLLIENPKEEQLENLNALMYSSEHLLSLVNNILDFNKIASGSLELEETDFNLKQILNGLQSIFHNEAKEKNISFIIEKDISLPKMVMGDSTRISQILTNLINNAIKFTEKGKVILNVSVINETKDSFLIEFVIKDTGIGIPEDKKDKIFKSFAQANSDTTRKYGGSGLGLSICKQLIEIMGSDLHLESEINKGSKFSFFLNFKKSSTINISQSNNLSNILDIEKQDNLKGTKILVAEDNKINIMVIKKFLTTWQVDYDFAENGLTALGKATTNDYDIILMDIEMPIMNGFDATKSIRETKKNAHIPIYALSASNSIDTKSKIKKFGMNGLICKPFNPPELYIMLSRIIHEKQAI